MDQPARPPSHLSPRHAPRVLIGASCWAATRRELCRVLPGEGLVVPLLALEPRQPLDHPCAPVELRAIARLVIARVVRVPAALQANGRTRVSVLPSTDAIVRPQVEELLRRHPALRACARWTSPSR